MKNQKNQIKYVLLFVVLQLPLSLVGQPNNTTGLSTSFNNVWGYIQLALVFVIVITFAIGVVVVYNKKSSGNADDFRKALMSFIYGIIFLFVALGFITVIKTFAAGALTGTNFN